MNRNCFAALWNHSIQDALKATTKSTMEAYTVYHFSDYSGVNIKHIMAFIDNRGFPGGPLAWFNSNYTETPAGIGQLFGVISFWMQDAFLMSIM